MSESSSEASEADDALCDWLDEFASTPAEPFAVPAAADGDADESAFEPAPHEVVAGGSGWVESAATSLNHNGFCVLRSSDRLVPRDVCSACADSAERRLSTLLELARRAGHERPRRDVMRYSEVCSRTAGGMRFDVRLPAAGEPAGGAVAPPPPPPGLAVPPCWADFREHVTRWVAPVLRRAAGVAEVFDDSSGFVTALAGAPDQHFHPDGTAAGLVNVFSPLIPVTFENGPTELRPGSHVWRETALGVEPRWDARRTLPVAPALGAGEILLFDYRVYHRGLANRSANPRPVGYLIFATRDGLRDLHNFPSDSLADAAGAAGGDR